VIQIVVQEVTNAFCKKFSGIAFAEIFCHVHHHADIVDLFGSFSLWALQEKMISGFAFVALHYDDADRFVQSFTRLFRESRIGYACPELFQAENLTRGGVFTTRSAIRGLERIDCGANSPSLESFPPDLKYALPRL
jgi:hypothetical protein